MPDLQRESDTMDSSRILPPEIKIVQGSSRNQPADSKVGQFYNSVSGESFDSFQMVYVDMEEGRRFWGRETIEDEPPACWCPNTKFNQSADGQDCTKCVNKLDYAFSVPASERKKKCCIYHTIKGILLPDWVPFMLRITGNSEGEFSRLMSFFKYNPTIRDKQTGKPLYHMVIIPVTTEKVTSPSGPSYALKFGKYTFFEDPEEIRYSLLASASMLGQANLILAEGTEEQPPLLEEPGTEVQNPEVQPDLINSAPAAKTPAPAPKTPEPAKPNIRTIETQTITKTPEESAKPKTNPPPATASAAKTATPSPTTPKKRNVLDV
jgi:hypothetical protein